MASPVWTFFTVAEDNNSFAVCKTCSLRIPRGGNKTSSFNTTNLIAHLKSRHRGEAVLKEYEAAVVAASNAKTKTTRSVDVPIHQAFGNCKQFLRDSEKAKAHLEPRYTLPSRRFFSDVSLPALYDVVAQNIHNLIDNNRLHVSFTTDIWTSDVSPVSMLSLMTQWLDQDFNKKRCCTHRSDNNDNKTDDNNNSVSLLTMYEEVLEENNMKELTQSQTDNQYKPISQSP